MNDNKEMLVEETKPFEITDEIKNNGEPLKETPWLLKSVTRRFLVIALAIAVVSSAALSAGAMALITRQGKTVKNDTLNIEEHQDRGQRGSQPGELGKSPFGDQGGNNNDDGYSNGYGDNYSNGYGDSSGNGYDNNYNNGYGDSFGNGYDNNYNNGNGDSFGNGYDDNYINGYGNGNDDAYNDLFGDQGGNSQAVPSEDGQDNDQRQSSYASIGIIIREDSGVYVVQVTGENAKKAGFEEGDKIVSIEGKTIESSNDLITEVKNHKSGDTVSIVVDRNGQSVEISSVLE